MAKAPSVRLRGDSAKCPRCGGITYRIPRLLSQKILVGSKRFRCDQCNLIFLKWMGVTFGGAPIAVPRRKPPVIKPSVGARAPGAVVDVGANAATVAVPHPAVGATPVAFPYDIPELVPESVPEAVPEPVREEIAEAVPAVIAEGSTTVMAEAIPATCPEAILETRLESFRETFPDPSPETLAEGVPKATPEPIPSPPSIASPISTPIAATIPATSAASTSTPTATATIAPPPTLIALPSDPNPKPPRQPFKWPKIKLPAIKLPSIKLPTIKLPTIHLPKIKWPKISIRRPDFGRLKIPINWPDLGQMNIQVNWAGMIKFKSPTLTDDVRARMWTLGVYAAIAAGVLAVIAGLYLLWFVLFPYLLSGDRSIRF